MSTTVTYKGSTLTTVENETRTLTTRGKYLEDNITLVDETVPFEPELQTKSETYTPTTSQQTESITADVGYDALERVNVTVNAVATAEYSVDIGNNDEFYNDGANRKYRLRPYLFVDGAGWVSSDTAGAWKNYSAVPSGTTITPSTSAQTVGGTKHMMEGAVTVNAIPSEYIIPSGNKAITENGTGIDVAQYETVSVNVSGGGGITVEALSVTQNGTYTAPTGKAYSPVTVNVSGGGSSSASKKQINFIDYDGTILHSYTKSEWQSVTALPSNPSHTGLTAQGWNWTKAQIDAQLTAAPKGDIWAGQMYVTTSGDTEIDVVMYEGRLSPTLTVAVNGTVTVDWGDGTTADTVTGTSLTSRKAVAHTYTSGGNYTITIHVVSGSFTFYCSSTYNILRKNTSTNENRVYTTCIQSVRLGSGITGLGNYAFAYCGSLASITIPNSVTSMGTSVFSNCYSLASLILPNGLTGISAEVCSTCYSLANISLPNGVTSIPNYAFQNCFTLASITIPNGVTSTGTSTFSNCQSLASVTIPSGVTSIGTSFSSCYGVAEYHIKPTSVPTLSSGAFASIPSDCIIYVPSASLEAYKTASNWSSYASKMQGE